MARKVPRGNRRCASPYGRRGGMSGSGRGGLNGYNNQQQQQQVLQPKEDTRTCYQYNKQGHIKANCRDK